MIPHSFTFFVGVILQQGEAFNLYAVAKRVEAIGRPYAKDMDTLFSGFSLFYPA